MEWIDAPPIGVYEGIDDKIYHAYAALNNTQLGWMERSAAFCNHRRLSPPPTMTTQQQASRDFGTAMHMAILEPERFHKVVKVHPPGNRNSNAYKEARDELRDQGCLLVNQDKKDGCEVAMERFFSIPSAARDLLAAATRTEVTYIGEVHGGLSKCRLDWQIPDSGNGIRGEIKTTTDCRVEPFSKVIENLGYHRADVFYRMVCESVEPGDWPHSRIIALNNTPPFEHMVHEIQPPTIMLGELEVNRLAPYFHECMETGVWPGYSPDVQRINVPPWAFKRAGMNVGGPTMDIG